MKVCTHCATEKPLGEFAKDKHSHDGRTCWCKLCRRESAATWRAQNPDKSKKSVQNWEASHSVSRSIYRKDYRKALRFEVLSHYSVGVPHCQCCGEDQLDFLALDHPQGKGQTHRNGKASYQFYLSLRKNGYPNDPPLMVLCHNCNMALGFYGYCPHGTLARRDV